jgi:hypothetical protein
VYGGNILVGKLELITTVMNIKLFIAETLVKTNSGYNSVWNWESMRFHNDCPQPGIQLFQCKGKKVGPRKTQHNKEKNNFITSIFF